MANDNRKVNLDKTANGIKLLISGVKGIQKASEETNKILSKLNNSKVSTSTNKNTSGNGGSGTSTETTNINTNITTKSETKVAVNTEGVKEATKDLEKLSDATKKAASETEHLIKVQEKLKSLKLDKGASQKTVISALSGLNDNISVASRAGVGLNNLAKLRKTLSGIKSEDKTENDVYEFLTKSFTTPNLKPIVNGVKNDSFVKGFKEIEGSNVKKTRAIVQYVIAAEEALNEITKDVKVKAETAVKNVEQSKKKIINTTKKTDTTTKIINVSAFKKDTAKLDDIAKHVEECKKESDEALVNMLKTLKADNPAYQAASKVLAERGKTFQNFDTSALERNGKNITIDDFKKAFGITDVLIEDIYKDVKDRQKALNKAYDDFLKFSKTTGITPSSIGNNRLVYGITKSIHDNADNKGHSTFNKISVTNAGISDDNTNFHELGHQFLNKIAERVFEYRLNSTDPDKKIDTIEDAVAKLFSDIDLRDAIKNGNVSKKDIEIVGQVRKIIEKTRKGGKEGGWLDTTVGKNLTAMGYTGAEWKQKRDYYTRNDEVFARLVSRFVGGYNENSEESLFEVNNDKFNQFIYPLLKGLFKETSSTFNNLVDIQTKPSSTVTPSKSKTNAVVEKVTNDVKRSEQEKKVNKGMKIYKIDSSSKEDSDEHVKSTIAEATSFAKNFEEVINSAVKTFEEKFKSAITTMADTFKNEFIKPFKQAIDSIGSIVTSLQKAGIVDNKQIQSGDVGKKLKDDIRSDIKDTSKEAYNQEAPKQLYGATRVLSKPIVFPRVQYDENQPNYGFMTINSDFNQPDENGNLVALKNPLAGKMMTMTANASAKYNYVKLLDALKKQNQVAIDTELFRYVEEGTTQASYEKELGGLLKQLNKIRDSYTKLGKTGRAEEVENLITAFGYRFIKNDKINLSPVYSETVNKKGEIVGSSVSGWTADTLKPEIEKLKNNISSFNTEIDNIKNQIKSDKDKSDKEMTAFDRSEKFKRLGMDFNSYLENKSKFYDEDMKNKTIASTIGLNYNAIQTQLTKLENETFVDDNSYKTQLARIQDEITRFKNNVKQAIVDAAIATSTSKTIDSNVKKDLNDKLKRDKEFNKNLDNIGKISQKQIADESRNSYFDIKAEQKQEQDLLKGSNLKSDAINEMRKIIGDFTVLMNTNVQMQDESMRTRSSFVTDQRYLQTLSDSNLRARYIDTVDKLDENMGSESLRNNIQTLLTQLKSELTSANKLIDENIKTENQRINIEQKNNELENKSLSNLYTWERNQFKKENVSDGQKLIEGVKSEQYKYSYQKKQDEFDNKIIEKSLANQYAWERKETESQNKLIIKSMENQYAWERKQQQEEDKLVGKSLENQLKWEQKLYKEQQKEQKQSRLDAGQKLIDSVKSEQNLYASQKKEEDKIKSARDKSYKFIDEQMRGLSSWYFSDNKNQIVGSDGYSNLMDAYQILSSRISSDEIRTDKTAIEHAIADFKAAIDDFKKSVNNEIKNNENSKKANTQQLNIIETRFSDYLSKTMKINGNDYSYEEIAKSLELNPENIIKKINEIKTNIENNTYNGKDGLMSFITDMADLSTMISSLKTGIKEYEDKQNEFNKNMDNLLKTAENRVSSDYQNISNQMNLDSEMKKLNEWYFENIKIGNSEFRRDSIHNNQEAYLGLVEAYATLENRIKSGEFENDPKGFRIAIKQFIDAINTFKTNVENSVKQFKQNTEETYKNKTDEIKSEQNYYKWEQEAERRRGNQDDVNMHVDAFIDSLNSQMNLDGHTAYTRGDMLNRIDTTGDMLANILLAQEEILNGVRSGAYINDPNAFANALNNLTSLITNANTLINQNSKRENSLQVEVRKMSNDISDFERWVESETTIDGHLYKRGDIQFKDKNGRLTSGREQLSELKNVLASLQSIDVTQMTDESLREQINILKDIFSDIVKDIHGGVETIVTETKNEIQQRMELQRLEEKLMREAMSVQTAGLKNAGALESQLNKIVRNPTMNTLFANSGDPYLKGNIKVYLTEAEGLELGNRMNRIQNLKDELLREVAGESAAQRIVRLTQANEQLAYEQLAHQNMIERIGVRVRPAGEAFNEYQEIYAPLMQRFAQTTGFNIFKNPNERSVNWETIARGFVSGNRTDYAMEIAKFINFPSLKDGFKQLYNSISKTLKGVVSMVQSAFDKIYKLGKSVFVGLSVAVGGVTASVTGAIAAFTAFGKNIITTTDEFRKTTIALTGVYRTPAKAQEMVQMAYKASSGLPLSYADAMQTLNEISAIPSVQNLLRSPNSNVSSSMMDKMFKVITSMTTMRPDKTASDAVFSLRNAMAGDLRSLQRRFDLPVNSITNIRGGVGLGAVKNDPIALLDSLSSYFDSFLDIKVINQISRTIGIITEKIKGAIDLFKSQIGNSGFYDLVLKDFQKLQDKIVDFVSSDYGKQIAKRFSNAFSNMYESIKGIIAKISESLLNAFNIKVSTNNVMDMIAGLSEAFAKSLRYVESLIKDIDFESVIKNIINTISNFDIGTIVTKAKSYGSQVIDIIKDVTKRIVDNIKWLKDTLKSMGLSDETISKGLIVTWLVGPGNAINTISSVISTIPAMINTGLGTIGSAVAIKSATDMSKGIGASTAIGGSITAVGSLVLTVGKILTVLGLIYAALKAPYKLLESLLTGIIKGIAFVGKELIKVFTSLLKRIVDLISYFISDNDYNQSINALNDERERLLSSIKDWRASAVTWIKETINPMKQGWGSLNPFGDSSNQEEPKTEYEVQKELMDALAASIKKANGGIEEFGYCARTVNKALNEMNLDLLKGHADEVAYRLERNKNFKQINLGDNYDKLRKLYQTAGYVVTYGKTKEHEHGHIEVTIGNGKGMSDHTSDIENLIQKLVNGEYSNVRAYAPVSTGNFTLEDAFDVMQEYAEKVKSEINKANYTNYEPEKVETDYIAKIRTESKKLDDEIRGQRSKVTEAYGFDTVSKIFGYGEDVNSDTIKFGSIAIERMKTNITNVIGNVQKLFEEFEQKTKSGEIHQDKELLKAAIDNVEKIITSYEKQLAETIEKSAEMLEDAVANMDFQYIGKDVQKFVSAQSRTFDNKLLQEVMNNIRQQYSGYFAVRGDNEGANGLINNAVQNRNGDLKRLLNDYSINGLRPDMLQNYSVNMMNSMLPSVTYQGSKLMDVPAAGIVGAQVMYANLQSDILIVDKIMQKFKEFYEALQPVVDEQNRIKVMVANVNNMRLGELNSNWNLYMTDKNKAVRSAAGERYMAILNEGIETDTLEKMATRIVEITTDSFSDIRTLIANGVKQLVTDTQTTMKNGIVKLATEGGTVKPIFKEMFESAKKTVIGVYAEKVANDFTGNLFKLITGSDLKTPKTPEEQHRSNVENGLDSIDNTNVQILETLKTKLESIDTNIQIIAGTSTSKKNNIKSDKERQDKIKNIGSFDINDVKNIGHDQFSDITPLRAIYLRGRQKYSQVRDFIDDVSDVFMTTDIDKFINPKNNELPVTFEEAKMFANMYKNGYIQKSATSNPEKYAYPFITQLQPYSNLTEDDRFNINQMMSLSKLGWAVGSNKDTQVFMTPKYSDSFINKLNNKSDKIASESTVLHLYSENPDYQSDVIDSNIKLEELEKIEQDSLQVSEELLRQEFERSRMLHQIQNQLNYAPSSAYVSDDYENILQQNFKEVDKYFNTLNNGAEEFEKLRTEIGNTGYIQYAPVQHSGLEQLNYIPEQNPYMFNTLPYNAEYMSYIKPKVDDTNDTLKHIDNTLTSITSNSSISRSGYIDSDTASREFFNNLEPKLSPEIENNVGDMNFELKLDNEKETNRFSGNKIDGLDLDLSDSIKNQVAKKSKFVFRTNDSGNAFNRYFGGFMSTGNNAGNWFNNMLFGTGKKDETTGMMSGNNNGFLGIIGEAMSGAGSSIGGLGGILNIAGGLASGKGILSSIGSFLGSSANITSPAGIIGTVLGGGAKLLMGGKIGGAVATKVSGALSSGLGSAILPVAAVAYGIRKLTKTKDKTAEGRARGAEFDSLRTSLVNNRNAMARNYYMANEDTVEALRNYEFGAVNVQIEKKGGIKRHLKGTARKVAHTDASAFTNSMQGYWNLIQKADEENRATQRSLNRLQNTNNMEYLRQSGLYEEKRKSSIQTDLDKYKEAVSKYAGRDAGFKQTLFDGKEYTLTELNDKVNDLIKELGDSTDVIAQNTEAIRQEKLATEDAKLDYETALYGKFDPLLSYTNELKKLENEWQSVVNDDGTVGYKEDTKEWYQWNTKLLQATENLEDATENLKNTISTDWISSLKTIQLSNGNYDSSQVKTLKGMYTNQTTFNDYRLKSMDKLETAIGDVSKTQKYSDNISDLLWHWGDEKVTGTGMKFNAITNLSNILNSIGGRLSDVSGGTSVLDTSAYFSNKGTYATLTGTYDKDSWMRYNYDYYNALTKIGEKYGIGVNSGSYLTRYDADKYKYVGSSDGKDYWVHQNVLNDRTKINKYWKEFTGMTYDQFEKQYAQNRMDTAYASNVTQSLTGVKENAPTSSYQYLVNTGQSLANTFLQEGNITSTFKVTEKKLIDSLSLVTGKNINELPKIVEKAFAEAQKYMQAEIEHYKANTAFKNTVRGIMEGVNNIFDNVDEKISTKISENIDSILLTITESDFFIKENGYQGYDQLNEEVILPLIQSIGNNFNDMASVYANLTDSGYVSQAYNDTIQELQNSLMDKLIDFQEQYRIASMAGASEKELQEIVNNAMKTTNGLKGINELMIELNDEFASAQNLLYQSNAKNSILSSISGYDDYSVANTALSEFKKEVGTNGLKTLMGGNIDSFSDENIAKLTGVSAIKGTEDPYEMYYEWQKKNIKQRIENEEEGSQEWNQAMLDMWNLMKDNADYLKKKAEETKNTIEDMLGKIEETVKTRVAEESKSTKGDFVYIDMGATRKGGEQYARQLLNSIKTDDPEAQKLIKEVAKRMGVK